MDHKRSSPREIPPPRSLVIVRLFCLHALNELKSCFSCDVIRRVHTSHRQLDKNREKPEKELSPIDPSLDPIVDSGILIGADLATGDAHSEGFERIAINSCQTT